MTDIFLSDLHIGSPLFDIEEGFIELLKNGYNKLYLLGDVLDTWEMRLNSILVKYASLIEFINSLGTRVEIVKGNHDPNFEILKIVFYNNIVHKKNAYTMLDGNKVIMMHGHKWDWVLPIYKFILDFFLNPMYGFSEKHGLDLRNRLRNKYYEIKYNIFTYNIISDIERRAVKEYKDKYDIIIMGHTHMPKIVDTPFCKYINCGCLVYKPAFIEYSNKKFKLVRI